MKRFALVLALTSGVASAAPRWVDTPAWPAKADAIDVTWVVYPVKDPTTPGSKAPLTLEIAIGGVTRTIKLDDQLGGVSPINEVVCKTTAYPLEKHEVAKITFYEGGAGGYFIRRSGTVLTVVDWFLSDGACEGKHKEPVACPRHEKPALQLHAPNVPIREHIVEVDAKGARHAFICT